MKPLVFCWIAAIVVAVPSTSRAEADLDVRVSISFKAAQPQVVFGPVAKQLGLEGNIDPALQRPISITLEDVTIRTFLDAACDSLGCTWRIEGNTLVITALPPDPARGKTWVEPEWTPMPGGSRFVNERVRRILDAIARVTGEGFRFDIRGVDPAQRVTVDVSHQDALRAIATVARAAGLVPGTSVPIRLQRPGQKPTIFNVIVPK